MGHAVTAFRDGLGITARNPAYLGVAVAAFVVAGLVSLLLNVTLGLVPLVGQLLASLLNGVVVTPIIAAGVLGMAYATSVDQGSPKAFVEAIKRRGKSMIGAYAILNLAFITLMVGGSLLVAVIAVFVLGFGTSMMQSANPQALSSLVGGTGLVVLGLGLLVGLVVLFAGLVLQFVGVAVVVGGETATSAFRAAWRVFRNNPLSVLGYSALRAVPALVVGVVAAVAFAVGQQAVGTMVGILLAAAAAVLVGAFAYAFLNAYHVVYYRRVTA